MQHKIESDAETKIEVRGLTKIFGKRINRAKEMLKNGKTKPEILKATGATVGVDRADFSIKTGEIFVIMGLSGSGKSTTLRMLNRLIEPTAGQVLIDGDDIAKMDKQGIREIRRKKLSMVFQGFALLPNRTVLQNAAFGLEIQGMDKDERETKANKALDLVGLNGFADQYPDQLSGGMQQRVGLARALASDAEILLMDEAFSALDPLNRRDMQDELLDLQEDMHKTIVFISHDLNEALRIGDHIMIMKDGEIVQIGTPEEILSQPADDYVEKFIEGVDRSQVYTAANVMIRANTVNIDKDGPRLAARRMRDNEISSLYVVNTQRKLVGILDADDVRAAIDAGKKDLKDIVKTDVPTTKMDTPLADLLDAVSTTSVPYAVIDDRDRLRGIIIRGAVLGALAGQEVNVNV
ncbi:MULTISPECIES: glycine betaine/L-proline ABC transporter ATP-binding protein [Lacticaseibacillus]|jgi:glycine betaine/proline transport system ATP-binding protein|uniref:Quaternary amine transport ATP-binding protein n=3 Tax=Lacticaseibacillus TaxID=2759736 RepID=A0AAN1KEU1_LACCA|nr:MULTISPECIES: glycine betaine/L-proline ABC transporter ATP-binding protein [Lacticaseibacillus]ARY92094.1 glycine betaine/L-proline ABC transporter ATP-binding protein [Lacticaseibacillus casei]KAB1971145.1 glycine betaine/L-proline ABC transporter ATP-binding protein [Lacticaseibacillus casei]QVI37229.1 glycine betaine/L-proline ABC transporter ATP-binding protein [Lacticaseibacillus casei]QXG59021.1 glycine betaine/L-proline ABC transporter ATP-binding protein [Lacticaseibacillus casei]W